MTDITDDRQRKRLLSSWVVIILALLLAFLVLVVATAVWFLLSDIRGTTSATLDSGRTVTATADSLFLNASFGGDVAVVETGGDRIIVQPDAVLVNDRIVQSLDPRSMNVDVQAIDGKITVTSDTPIAPAE